MNHEIKERLARALHPDSIKVSPSFTAMLSFFLDQDWVNPAITEVVITSDGIVLMSTASDPYHETVGEASVLFDDLVGVADAAELDDEEEAALISLAKSRITDWRN